MQHTEEFYKDFQYGVWPLMQRQYYAVALFWVHVLDFLLRRCKFLRITACQVLSEANNATSKVLYEDVVDQFKQGAAPWFM